jgi:hypothetical protein
MFGFRLIFAVLGAFDSGLGKERKVTRIAIEASGVFEGRLTIKKIPLKPGGTPPKKVPAVDPSTKAAKIIGSMLKGGMIDRKQAHRLLRRWHVLSEDDFAHPELRVIRDHTRVVLVKMAVEERHGR